jgi:pyruvate dehydrogenase E2 component (dihydrolipoamide acetyltransferase)
MNKILIIPFLNENDAAGSGTIVSIPISIGDWVEIDDTVLEIETDKVTVEVPATIAGKVESIHVQMGQEVNQGTEFAALSISSYDVQSNEEIKELTSMQVEFEKKPSENSSLIITPSEKDLTIESRISSEQTIIPASPSTRRLARKLGVNLAEISNASPSGRVTIEDVENFVKRIISQYSHSSEATKTLETPANQALAAKSLNITSDLNMFGSIRSEKASKMVMATSRNMTHAWSTIPHAWLQQNIDITDLEVWRKEHKEAGGSLTITVIIAKAIAIALKAFPKLNSSLDEVNNLIHYKEYYDVGVAVDTPNGLVVPSLRSVESKGLEALSAELRELSQLAHSRKLKPNDMQGAGITLSNLGGIGLNAIFPIVNWPQAAIVGVAASELVPKYINDELYQRRVMTATLGFDHRIINGADGARFLTHLKMLLEDIRRLVV